LQAQIGRRQKENTDRRRTGASSRDPAAFQTLDTIIGMPAMQEYCGDVLNFKTYSKGSSE